jgi:1-acyl-sn-glycerol-3-phosphate acyltransferase
VVVANHCSFADVGLLSFFPWEMKWLSKRTIFYIPAIGTGMWVAGDVPLDRGNRDSAKFAMSKMKEWLELGANVMIFPEGTRSEDGKMGEFKDGAFRLAIETQSDILPCAVVGTSNALRKGSWKMNPAKGRVMCGNPISTKGMTMDNVEKLKTQVRIVIVQMCNEMEKVTGISAESKNVSLNQKKKN